MEQHALATSTATSASVLLVSMDSTVTKVQPSSHRRNLPIVGFIVETIVLSIRSQCAQPQAVVATKMEDVSISADNFQIVHLPVSVLRDIAWTRTTAAVCLKVWARILWSLLLTSLSTNFFPNSWDNSALSFLRSMFSAMHTMIPNSTVSTFQPLKRQSD